MLVSLCKSFKCAVRGVLYALKNERHMRIHSVVSVCVLILSVFFDLTLEKYALLFLTIALVVISEIFNSAVEGIIDAVSKDYDITAKAVKDMSAGAVFVAAGVAVVVGVILFHDIKGYLKILNFFSSHPIAWFSLTVFFVLSYFYIVLGPAEMKTTIKNMLK